MDIPLLPDFSLEQFRVKLTFDNGQIYEASTTNTEELDNIIINLKIQENEAYTAGTPMGIIDPNSCSIDIMDFSLNLLPTNTTSPYFGFMRNGVKVELFVSYDEGTSWEELGVYYTDGWQATKENGGFGLVTLSCTDGLSYIGNKEIPQLSAKISTDVVELLKDIFAKIGLTEEQYYIDPSLSLRMVFSIARGEKVRDVLNTIAQALVARITSNRAGVIEVRPAFPTDKTPKYKITTDGDFLENISLELNPDTVYNKVKLNYNQVDNQPSELLLQLTNVELKGGKNSLKNYFRNLEISQNIISIDNIRVSFAPDTDYTSGSIGYVEYTASQGSIDIQINSTFPRSVYVNIEVYGQPAGSAESSVERDLIGTDQKVGNTLSIESYIIQDETVADAYIDKVVNYLYDMGQRYTANGLISTKLNTGDYLFIESDDINLNGNYLVTQIHIDIGEATYSVNLGLVKLRG